ncbi:hypothetical protein Bcep18194_A4770 [Burkholderia lata]|uniref:Uncharacterized protein n=1 Tax=Burkholderia lata (strain ATCC 17760 / DSM 23089 / LMG 22485 / NCIMB 9086 / R18194 / 383) TaxID=482957 RepID=Q39GQ1_BURL3|nr:hypothetical protein Bcep18194_A4770 [Burkholderia lata]
MKIKDIFDRQPRPPCSALLVLAPAKSSAKRTKHCPTPPSLPDDNANIKSFSTNRKLKIDSINAIFSRKRLQHEYKRFAATLCHPHYFQYMVNSIVNSRS